MKVRQQLESVKLDKLVVDQYREISEASGKPIGRLMFEVLMFGAALFMDGKIAGLKKATGIMEGK